MFWSHTRRLSQAVGLRFGLAALLVGGLVLAQPASPARAAASLEASENPVVIPINANSKDVTISWFTNNDHKGELMLAVNNAAATKWAEGKSGSKQLTATYGSTYRFQLFDQQTGAVLGSLKVTTEKAKLSLDLGCASDCITDLDVTPHGTYASFNVTTNEPIASVSLSLSQSDSKAANGWFSSPFGPMLSKNFYVKPTAFDLNYLGLFPGASYFFRLEVKDVSGHSHFEEGTVKTLNRKITLVVDTIKVWEDSDAVTSGDLGFTFWMNGKEVFWPTTDPGDNWAGDGAELHPNFAIQKLDNQSTLFLKFIAYDDDYVDPLSPFPLYCSEETPPGVPCWQYAKATATDSFDLYVSGPGETFGKSFTLHAWDQGSGLDTTAYGKFEVTYVP